VRYLEETVKLIENADAHASSIAQYEAGPGRYGSLRHRMSCKPGHCATRGAAWRGGQHCAIVSQISLAITEGAIRLQKQRVQHALGSVAGDGSGRNSSPHHRMPVNSRHNRSTHVSMTWQAMFRLSLY